jgi:hypothetical protein
VTKHSNFPGWYLDASTPGSERFWNGDTWTDLTRPAPRLDDYFGPIEPLLLGILGEQDVQPLIAEPTSLDEVWDGYRCDRLTSTDQLTVDSTSRV